MKSTILKTSFLLITLVTVFSACEKEELTPIELNYEVKYQTTLPANVELFTSNNNYELRKDTSVELSDCQLDNCKPLISSVVEHYQPFVDLSCKAIQVAIECCQEGNLTYAIVKIKPSATCAYPDPVKTDTPIKGHSLTEDPGSENNDRFSDEESPSENQNEFSYETPPQSIPDKKTDEKPVLGTHDAFTDLEPINATQDEFSYETPPQSNPDKLTGEKPAFYMHDAFTDLEPVNATQDEFSHEEPASSGKTDKGTESSPNFSSQNNITDELRFSSNEPEFTDGALNSDKPVYNSATDPGFELENCQDKLDRLTAIYQPLADASCKQISFRYDCKNDKGKTVRNILTIDPDPAGCTALGKLDQLSGK